MCVRTIELRLSTNKPGHRKSGWCSQDHGELTLPASGRNELQLELRDDSLFQLLRDGRLFCWMSHREAADTTAQRRNLLSPSTAAHL